MRKQRRTEATGQRAGMTLRRTRLTRRAILRSLTAGAGLATTVFGSPGAAGRAQPVLASQSGGEAVIFLAAPRADDDYYAEIREELLDFDASFVAAARGRDRVFVVADGPTLAALRDRVPPENLLPGDLADVWLRDFGAFQAGDRLVKFVYRPAYLPRRDAAYIEDSFLRWMESNDLAASRSDLVLDGGNFVTDGQGKFVVTERVFADNHGMGRDDVIAMLRRELSIERLAILPEEPGDVTGHADGMATWLTPDRLAISRFAEPLRSQVLHALDRDLPGVEVVEVPYEYSGEIWKGFPDASGIYVNCLATAAAFYVPVYGLEQDAEALRAFEQGREGPVVAVDASGVGRMGGAVNCLSWHLVGEPARRFLSQLRAS